jgi:hypothetical protein
MTTRAKTINDALIQMASMWTRSPLPNELEIQRILARVYDAGQSNTLDFDAARWRLLESEFREVRATFNGYRAIAPTKPTLDMPFGPISARFDAYKATCWRLECSWVDLSNSADTLPEFITHLLKARRKEAA